MKPTFKVLIVVLVTILGCFISTLPVYFAVSVLFVKWRELPGCGLTEEILR